MTTNTKEPAELSYAELKDLLEKKKEAEIDKVTKELTSARGIVSSLEAQLVNLGVAPVLRVRRGRKPNAFKQNGTGPKKPAKAKKGKKRGQVGAAIRAFVESKGKAGAHVNDIAKHLGTKPANVTAFFYAKANKKEFKKVKPATFTLAK